MGQRSIEQAKLIRFLRGCRNLVGLKIEISLTQQFYDKLDNLNIVNSFKFIF